MTSQSRTFYKNAMLPALMVVSGLDNASAEQVASLTTEDDFLSGIPVVLTATRLSQDAMQAPSSITVIDSAMIRSSGAREIPDLFRLVPGFQVGMFTNNTHVVTSHGLAGNYQRRMQVLIDGRSAYITLLNTVDWATLDLDIEDIERIEVIRGSNSPVYGANAFSGVINIITKQPFLDKGTSVYLSAGAEQAGLLKQALKDTSVSATDSALSARKVTIRHGGSYGAVDYRLTVGYREDEGFRNIIHKGEYEITNDGKRMALANFRATYNPTLNDVLDVDFGISHGPMGAFKNPSDDVFDQVRDKEMTNHHQSFKWTRAKGSASEWQVHFYHNYYKEKDTQDIGTIQEVYARGIDVDPAADPTTYNQIGDAVDFALAPYTRNDRVLIGYYDGIGERYDLEVQHINNSIGNGVGLNGMRMVVGAGLRYDTMESQSLLNRADAVTDFSVRAFGNVEWRIFDPFAVNAGAMVERNEIVGTYASPRIAANYRFHDNHVVRASLTRAYRTPSLLENNIELGVQFSKDREIIDIHTVHAENLKSEEMTDFELGYVFEFPAAYVTGDVKYFREWLRNGIQEVADSGFTGDPFPNRLLISDPTYGDSWIWDNAVRANVEGFEAQLRYRPLAHTLFAFNYGYAECTACSHIRDRDASGAVGIRNISGTVPQHTTSMLVSHRLPYQIDLSLTYYHVTTMKFLEEGFDLLPTIDRFDARVAKHFRLGNVKGEVATLLQNFTGEYNEFNYNYFFEPRAFADIRVGF